MQPPSQPALPSHIRVRVSKPFFLSPHSASHTHADQLPHWPALDSSSFVGSVGYRQVESVVTVEGSQQRLP
jgi:hypothetical protein